MKELDIYQVDAFTRECFGGNPAAVIPLVAWLEESLMQRIAAENNLSETAFFARDGDGFRIRWFTPAVEVPLCGHATLATTAVIHRELGHTSWPVRLQSASGPLTVDVDGDRYVLDFPANPPEATTVPEGFERALGGDIQECYSAGDIYMATCPDQASVETLAPDLRELARHTRHGVIATAAGNEVDFVSRFFAPALGIDEDPVTGAAHCVLAPYWSERLGKSKLEARQLSARGGEIECEVRGDRVLLRGHVAFYLRGKISIPE